MNAQIRTYLVGRRNSTVSCDISVPEHERSVSRKHLELTLTASGECYLVHVHPQNTTEAQDRNGAWHQISQEYVELDTPLRMGDYQTTARNLLAMLPRVEAPALPEPSPGGGEIEWDPDTGTFLRRR